MVYDYMLVCEMCNKCDDGFWDKNWDKWIRKNKAL